MPCDRTHLKSALKLGFTTFATCFGVIWTLIQVYSYFKMNWFHHFEMNTLWVGIVIGSSAICALGAGAIRLAFHTAPPVYAPSFDRSLIDALEAELQGRNYADVIRIGLALNRPLFEEGKFATRLKIGKIVEEAAALCDRKEVQVVALIDAIGWSFVELGNYSEAKRSIEHGLALANETGQSFYRAKGERHLGVICRRTGDFQGARKCYEESMATAQAVPSEREREELIAGLYYAQASLCYFTDDFSGGMTFIEKAITSFLTLKDDYRLNMSCVLKGDIQFKLDQKAKARDTFRYVLQRADRNTEKLQVVRSMLGLAEVYLAENNWEGVQKMVQQVDDIKQDQFKAEMERLKALKARLPNRSLLGSQS